MASKKKKTGLISKNKTVADNRRARYDYAYEEMFEAGIELTGTEVKSLRHGQCSLNESYVGPQKGEIWLFNAHIPEYQQAAPKMQHDPKRTRRLLLHKRQVNQLMGAVSREGYSIIANKLYFNDRGMVKLEIALAKGKKQHDKRDVEKKRDWAKEKGRILREKG